MDTSQLVHNVEAMFRPDRTACFVDQEQETNMVKTANFPQKSLLARIFNEKTFFPEEMVYERHLLNSDRCLIQRDAAMMELQKSDHVYFVGSQTVMSFILMFASMLLKSRSVWISDEPLYEYPLVSYFSTRHSRNPQRYHVVWVSTS